MKCDELKAYKGDVYIPVYGSIADAEVYLKKDADTAIAELKDKCQMHDFFWEGCGFKKLGFKNSINVRDYCDELKRQNEDLIPKCRKANKELRHNKYRRCLAMAKWCRMHDEFTQLESERLGLQQRTLFFEYRKKAMWWNKWCKRWLELAEQFKEAE